MSGHKKKQTKRGTLTNWRQQRERLVRIWKKIDYPRCTHSLEMAEGGTCQDMERNKPSKAHSLPEDSRGRELSGHGKNRPGEAHSPSRDSREREFVRTQKKTDRVRHTHKLETVEGQTC